MPLQGESIPTDLYQGVALRYYGAPRCGDGRFLVPNANCVSDLMSRLSLE